MCQWQVWAAIINSFLFPYIFPTFHVCQLIQFVMEVITFQKDEVVTYSQPWISTTFWLCDHILCNQHCDSNNLYWCRHSLCIAMRLRAQFCVYFSVGILPHWARQHMYLLTSRAGPAHERSCLIISLSTIHTWLCLHITQCFLCLGF